MSRYIIQRFYLKWARLKGTRIYLTCAKAFKSLWRIRGVDEQVGPTRVVIYKEKTRKKTRKK